MKKCFLIYTAFLSAASAAFGQAAIPFDVEKIDVKLISSVNGTPIHKEPSESSPIQLFKEVDDDVVYYWSNSKSYPKSSISKFLGPTLISGESNGWYDIGNKANTESEWVNGKYCKISAPTPITKNHDMGFEKFNWRWIEYDGPDKYAVFFSNSADEPSEGVLYLGKIRDGILECPYVLGTPSHPVKLKANNNISVDFYDTDTNWVIEYGPSVSSEFGWTSYFDLSKLPSSAVDRLLDKMSLLPKPAAVYIGEYDVFEVFTAK